MGRLGFSIENFLDTQLNPLALFCSVYIEASGCSIARMSRALMAASKLSRYVLIGASGVVVA